MLNGILWTVKNSLEYARVECGSRRWNVGRWPCTLLVECVTWSFMVLPFTVNIDLKLSLLMLSSHRTGLAILACMNQAWKSFQVMWKCTIIMQWSWKELEGWRRQGSTTRCVPIASMSKLHVDRRDWYSVYAHSLTTSKYKQLGVTGSRMLTVAWSKPFSQSA